VLNSLFKNIIHWRRWFKFLKWFLLEKPHITLRLKWEYSHKREKLWSNITTQMPTTEFNNTPRKIRVKDWFKRLGTWAKKFYSCATRKLKKKDYCKRITKNPRTQKQHFAWLIVKLNKPSIDFEWWLRIGTIKGRKPTLF